MAAHYCRANITQVFDNDDLLDSLKRTFSRHGIHAQIIVKALIFYGEEVTQTRSHVNG